jgi:effector-binding domain-containing protein
MAGESQGNELEFQQLAAQFVVSIRETIQITALSNAQGDMLQTLSRYLQQSGAQPAGPPFVRYHTFGATGTDLELGIPVVEPLAGEGRIASGALPGGPAITLWHLGAHDHTLRDAYGRLRAWPKEHGRQPSGAAWEVYYWIDPSKEHSPETWPAPSAWCTLLVQPLGD